MALRAVHKAHRIHRLGGGSPTCLGLGLQPKTKEDAAELGRLVGDTKAVLGAAWRREPAFHLSLSYHIPCRPNPDPERWRQLKEELSAMVDEQDIVVEAPVVCVSQSMLAFKRV